MSTVQTTNIKHAASASNNITLDSAGNVGVGIASPGTRLNVYTGSAANTFVRSQNTLGFADFGPLSDGTIYGPYAAPASGTNLVAGTSNSTPVTFWTNGGERMRITAAGNVGIGTSSPVAQLHVVNGSGNSESILGQFGTGTRAQIGAYANQVDIRAYNGTNDVLTLTTGATERMRITAAGNVGIGTSSPANLLTVNGVSRFDGTIESSLSPFVYSWQGGTSGQVRSGLQLDGANQILLFATATNERARITAGGDLLVGRTTLSTPSGMSTSNLQVSNGLSAFNGSVYTAYSVDRINFNAGNYFVLNQSSVGVVLPNGNTSWSAQSDERLKDVIEPIENAASKVASLRSVIGRYKTDDPTKRRAFLIAQDVQAVLPEAVTEDEQGYLLLAYTELVPLLTAALKEQQAQIEELKARVAALETK